MNERQREICEGLDWKVTAYEDGTVELEKYSPAGEDFSFVVKADGFAENVKEYAAGFDVDEHIAMWIMAKRSGTQGVPSCLPPRLSRPVRGRVSQEQQWFGDKVTEQGYLFHVAYGWEAAVDTLKWYLGGEDNA